jgi:hypothetical protein
MCISVRNETNLVHNRTQGPPPPASHYPSSFSPTTSAILPQSSNFLPASAKFASGKEGPIRIQDDIYTIYPEFPWQRTDNFVSMGVLKHSPTLVYAHSRSSSYLFFALAVSLARPQAAASAPTSKTPEGQGAEQPGAIEQQSNRLFSRLASSVSSHFVTFCPEELQAPAILCLLRPISCCPAVTSVDWNGWCHMYIPTVLGRSMSGIHPSYCNTETCCANPSAA